VILRYRGGAQNAPTLGIVGKGVTFDSGGLSLKPTESMLTMKCDKAGACTMVGALQAIAALKLPVNVLGIAGLVENMTGPAAMKLGDVLVARNGRTIEVTIRRRRPPGAGRRLAVADQRREDRRPATLTACVVAGIPKWRGDGQRPPRCDAVVTARAPAADRHRRCAGSMTT
jgi:leucyl aminopeptidase